MLPHLQLIGLRRWQPQAVLVDQWLSGLRRRHNRRARCHQRRHARLRLKVTGARLQQHHLAVHTRRPACVQAVRRGGAHNVVHVGPRRRADEFAPDHATPPASDLQRRPRRAATAGVARLRRLQQRQSTELCNSAREHVALESRIACFGRAVHQQHGLLLRGAWLKCEARAECQARVERFKVAVQGALRGWHTRMDVVANG
eukprot:363865-Chlamydomonas_euryale.AAC.26